MTVAAIAAVFAFVQPVSSIFTAVLASTCEVCPSFNAFNDIDEKM
jgi:hypothetical protein